MTRPAHLRLGWGILDDAALWRRVKYGGRKGRSALRRLEYRQRVMDRHGRYLDYDDYYRPWDYPMNFEPRPTSESL